MSFGDRTRLSRLRAAARHEQQRRDAVPTARAAPDLGQLYQRLKSILLNVIGVFVAVTIGLYIYDYLSKRSISIVKLSVPKSLADKGLSQEAATAKLHQALLAIEKQAGSRKRSANVVDSADKITIEVPTTGMSLDLVSDTVRKIFHISSGWKIAGFVIETRGAYAIDLSLKNGARSELVVIPSASSDDLDYEAAAIRIFESVEPYILAAYFYGKDKENDEDKEDYKARADEIAKSIIAGDASDETKSLSYNLLGNIYNDHWGRYGDAEKAYLSAIQLDERNEIAFNGLGNTYLNLRRYDDAIRAFERAIRLAPDYAAAYHRMGNAYTRKKDTAKAAELYAVAIAKNPRNDLALRDLGILRSKAGDLAGAIDSFEKAVDVEPGDADHKKLLADAYRQAGRTADAAAVQRAIDAAVKKP